MGSNFSFGNVLTENLNNMVYNENLKLIHEEIKKGVELCRNTCEYFELCGSSKPDAKLSANSSLPHQGRFDTTESFHCLTSIKTMADIIYSDIKNNIDK